MDANGKQGAMKLLGKENCVVTTIVHKPSLKEKNIQTQQYCDIIMHNVARKLFNSTPVNVQGKRNQYHVLKTLFKVDLVMLYGD